MQTSLLHGWWRQSVLFTVGERGKTQNDTVLFVCVCAHWHAVQKCAGYECKVTNTNVKKIEHLKYPFDMSYNQKKIH